MDPETNYAILGALIAALVVMATAAFLIVKMVLDRRQVVDAERRALHGSSDARWKPGKEASGTEPKPEAASKAN